MIVALQDIFQLLYPVPQVAVEGFYFLRFQIDVIEPDKEKRSELFYLEGMRVLR